MANLSKARRERMIAYLNKLRDLHSDDESLSAINEIEQALLDKKFGLVFEQHSELVDEMLEENIPVFIDDKERRIVKDVSMPMNFVIEGDNLQALYLLQKTQRSSVDLIYIDPPYNSGARDWKYDNDYVDKNDAYRHSKWLSMMKNRLLLAKQMLKPENSVLICAIDEKEYAHLACLLEEIFSSARIEMVTTVISAKGVYREGEFSRVEEHLFFVCLGDAAAKQQEFNMLDPQIKRESNRSIEWIGLRRREPSSKRDARPNQFYPIYIDIATGEIDSIGDAVPLGIDRNTIDVPFGKVAVWPLDSHGTETLWGLTPEALRANLSKGYVKANWNPHKQSATIYYLPSGTIEDIEAGVAVVTGKGTDGSIIAEYPAVGTQPPKRVWNLKTHNAETYGTKILSAFIGNGKFPFPKSLYAVYDAINFYIGDKPNAIVVDFFAGSGTTLHAVNLLNAKDGGKRRCILVSNNELSEKDKKELTSLGLKPGDKEWEMHGICQSVTWPRTLCTIMGKSIDGTEPTGTYLGSDRKFADGFTANAKYLKCDWTPRKPEDYLLSNALCLHIKEMLEVQNGIEIDNKRFFLIINRNDLLALLAMVAKGDSPNVERVWVNQNMVLSSDELKALKAIGFKYIPKEFFGEEMKEAGE